MFCPVFYFGKAPAVCLPRVRENFPIVSLVHRNVLQYIALACESLVTMKVKMTKTKDSHYLVVAEK